MQKVCRFIVGDGQTKGHSHWKAREEGCVVASGDHSGKRGKQHRE